ncbi:hypothetical protein [Nocardia sp. NPDC052566]|uniref:hypothetical protein n=1 Tax=Nocardia sp. NPDC052566 TaxID=3364330 RepID=UPI0037C97FA0
MLAATTLLSVVQAPSADAAPFGSADVGFAEGSSPSGADLEQRLTGMQQVMGSQQPLLRLDLDWWYVEDQQGAALRWDRVDPAVDAAAARGMKVLLVLAYAPPWANGGHSNDKWFPVRDRDWSSIVDRTVAHFGNKVHAYEVWNEPNFVSFGNYGSDRKTRYWQLVRIAKQRVKARCSTCVVLAGASGGGTPESGGNPNESAVWLDWAYTHGYKLDFDAVAHHPYPAWSSGKGPADPECVNRWWNMFGPAAESPVCGELALVHSVMVERGDSGKKIWATEFGYPTEGLSSIPSREIIRNYLVQGVNMWRSLPYTGPLFLYSYRDRCSDATDPECHFGMVTDTFTAKEPITADLGRALRGDSG